MKYNIEDIVKFKGKQSGSVISQYYTEGSGIPTEKITHGSVLLGSNYNKEFAVIKDIWSEYYIVEYEDSDNKLVRLGFKEEDLELESKKGVISKFMKLNSMMRRLLNADLKRLIKAGLMNGDLLLTEEGKNALYALLVEVHKKELVEIANEIIKENKEEENN